MNKIVVFFLLLTSTLTLGGCSLYSGTQNTTQNLWISPTSTQEPTTKSNTINIQNFSFNPGVLTVKKGDTVTWTNNDSSPHQIKSASFNSSQLTNGQSFSFTFTNSGTFDYSCAIHPAMTGKIIVK